jgi:energy-coupling factor transporter ATP-binding protein EcfA2
VTSGRIDLNASESLRLDRSNILGIYGQNGSGKTVVIEALAIIKAILSGYQIPRRYLDIITFGEKFGTLEVEFAIIDSNNTDCIAVYSCEIEQRDNPNETDAKNGAEQKEGTASILVIKSESLKVSGLINGERYPSQYIAQSDEGEDLIRPKQKCKLLFGEDENTYKFLQLHKVLALYGSRSFIFSHQTLGIINDNPELDFNRIILSLRYFATAKLFIVGGEMQNEISFPINFVDEHEDGGSVGRIPFTLESKTTVPKRIVDVIESVLPPMNRVLPSMIPGLNIKHKSNKLSLDEKEDKYEIELFATREQGFDFPLRHESLGIKKITSFLSVLIAAYNDPSYVLAVDEFDSSIFEYLLGELISVIKESGRGQLIFTSHNLRPLEKLDDTSIRFTTTDPKNRYVKLKKKATNNLRDMYFRVLSLGSNEFELYSSESKHALALAFRQAGWKE